MTHPQWFRERERIYIVSGSSFCFLIGICLFQASKLELLQTPLENALHWAEKGVVEGVGKSFLPCKAESFSFAPLQPVTGSSAKELHALLQERIYAMEITDTLQRLQNVIKHAQQNRASLAAKVALQSLQF